MSTATTTRKVPGAALCLSTGPLQFAAGEQADPKKGPLKMRARSGDPIHHWYWGKVVHDMAGFSPAKPTIPADYCHDPREIVGYLNKFSASNEGLDAEGEIVSVKPGDRAEDVMLRGNAGIPYESSIFFDPQVIEEVLQGGSAQVNGYSLEGPALIIRKWTTRGIAVCPYGYDPRTSSQFSAGGIPDEVEVPFFQLPTELAMSTAAIPAQPAATEATKLAAPAAGDNRQQLSDELKKFVDKFGAANGAAWFTAGKSYTEALELHVAAFGEQLKGKDDEIAGLKAKLAAVPRGEDAPVSGGGDTAPPKERSKFAHLGDNTAKIAEGIKLPGKH
jgi:hypothetical protein